jgi:hypothetical protein
MYARVKNYPESSQDYENIFGKDSLYAKSFLLQYATSLAGMGKFEQALENTNKFLSILSLNEKKKNWGLRNKKVLNLPKILPKKIALKIIFLTQ